MRLSALSLKMWSPGMSQKPLAGSFFR